MSDQFILVHFNKQTFPEPVDSANVGCAAAFDGGFGNLFDHMIVRWRRSRRRK